MTRWKISLEDWEKANAKGKQPIKPGQIAVLSEKGDGKYKAKRTVVDNLKFPSKLEADYYMQLKLQQKMGCILGFGRQIRFNLGAGVEYVADFVVWGMDGVAEVVETKGFDTDCWIVKRKFFTEKYPKIKLTIVRKI